MCCCSFIGQILFGAIMVVAVGLTLGSMFSPGWTQFKNATENAGEDILHMEMPESTGIFPFLCQMPSGENVKKDGQFDFCLHFWETLPTWEKAVVACMVLALLTEVVALLMTLISICACCCKQIFVFILPILALLASVFLLVAVTVFGIYNKDMLGTVHYTGDVAGNVDDTIGAVKDSLKTEAGYSFYLALGALAATVIDIIVGSLTKCLANKCL